jgi:RNA polymerase sigma factor (sigma-70 family)
MSDAELGAVLLPTTSWTLVEGAARGDPDARRQVFERYYWPVCAYIARIVRDASVAEEYATDFFLDKVFKEEGEGLLEKVDRERTFRPYLKVALRNFVKDRWRRNKPDREAVRPDARESGWARLPGEEPPDAEEAFDWEWVRMLLTRALKEVRRRCEERDQLAHLEIFLARFASDEQKAPSWAEIGARYQLGEKKARSRAETVQKRFRTALWKVLEAEVGPEAATEELATLLAILRDAR